MAPFSWRNLFGGRKEPEVVEPEQCRNVRLPSRQTSVEVCKTPDSISKKYGCEIWVPMQFLSLLFGEESSKYVKKLRLVNMKRGESVSTYVCCEDVVSQKVKQSGLPDFEILELFIGITDMLRPKGVPKTQGATVVALKLAKMLGIKEPQFIQIERMVMVKKGDKDQEQQPQQQSQQQQ